MTLRLALSLALASLWHRRGVLGLGLHLGPLVVNTDYNIGRVNVLSVGLGLSF